MRLLAGWEYGSDRPGAFKELRRVCADNGYVKADAMLEGLWKG